MVDRNEIFQGGWTRHEPDCGLHLAGGPDDQFRVIGDPLQVGILLAFCAAADQLAAHVGEHEVQDLDLGEGLDKFPDRAFHEAAGGRMGGAEVSSIIPQQMGHVVSKRFR